MQKDEMEIDSGNRNRVGYSVAEGLFRWYRTGDLYILFLLYHPTFSKSICPREYIQIQALIKGSPMGSPKSKVGLSYLMFQISSIIEFFNCSL